MLKVSLEGALFFTKLSVRLAYCWPPPPNSTKWQNLKYDLMWSLSILSALGLLGPLLYSIYEYQSDPVLLTKSTCFLGAVSGFIIKLVVCRLDRQRIQVPALRPCTRKFNSQNINDLFFDWRRAAGCHFWDGVIFENCQTPGERGAAALRGSMLISTRLCNHCQLFDDILRHMRSTFFTRRGVSNARRLSVSGRLWYRDVPRLRSSEFRRISVFGRCYRRLSSCPLNVVRWRATRNFITRRQRHQGRVELA